MRIALTIFALALTCLTASGNALAGILARQQLATPLAPGMSSHLSIPVPPSVDPGQPLWVSYRTLALSADASPTGEIVLDGSFEGAATAIDASTVRFSPDTMMVSTSAGTIRQQFEANYGARSPQEMQTLLGADLYTAYQAANAGTGRILDGTIVKTLPALGKTDGILLVSVERASGIHPVGIFVTVGQGDIPAELQPNAGATGESSAFNFGYIMGLGAFLALLYWFFVARHRR